MTMFIACSCKFESVVAVSLKQSFFVSGVPLELKSVSADLFVGETLLGVGGQLMVDAIANQISIGANPEFVHDPGSVGGYCLR